MRPFRQTAEFSPAWWCKGPHAQTAWATLVRPRPPVVYRRERLETPDGDELVVDHVDGPEASPIVVLLHGLEGSSYSVYIKGFASALQKVGWRTAAVNFRSCARDPLFRFRMLPNRKPRLYHCGDTDDFDFVVETLRKREPKVPIFAVGASLGGNVLLKWLGEDPSRHGVRAAAAISVPFDPLAISVHLNTRRGQLYQETFLRTLRPKTVKLAKRHPELAGRIDLDRLSACRSVAEYDDAVTAPLHGFDSVEDYYSRCGSIGFLHKVSVPTMCISSADDPLFPAEMLAKAERYSSPAIEMLVTPAGGHVGFVSGDSPLSASYWHEECILQFLSQWG